MVKPKINVAQQSSIKLVVKKEKVKFFHDFCAGLGLLIVYMGECLDTFICLKSSYLKQQVAWRMRFHFTYSVKTRNKPLSNIWKEQCTWTCWTTSTTNTQSSQMIHCHKPNPRMCEIHAMTSWQNKAWGIVAHNHPELTTMLESTLYWENMPHSWLQSKQLQLIALSSSTSCRCHCMLHRQAAH